MTRGDNLLKYKNIYNHRHGGTPVDHDKTETLTEKDLDNFLEKEKTKYDNEPWNKLNKTDKVKKLYIFAETYVTEKDIPKEKTMMEKFLKLALEKKKFAKIKDLKYDRISGKILDLTGLTYDALTNKFSIVRTSEVSTSKQLGTPKKSRPTSTKTVKKTVNSSSSSLPPSTHIATATDDTPVDQVQDT
jgi:hypothetical protein